MTMGHRDKLKTGDEWDIIGRCRRMLKFTGRPGICSRIKNAINRRARRAAKDEVRAEIEDAQAETGHQ